MGFSAQQLYTVLYGTMMMALHKSESKEVGCCHTSLRIMDNYSEDFAEQCSAQYA